MKHLALMLLTLLTVGCNDAFRYTGIADGANDPSIDEIRTEDGKIYEREVIQVEEYGTLAQSASAQPLDILFTIDNSGSMGSYHQGVKNKIGDFMQEFTSLPNLNWKIGLISSDDRTTTSCGNPAPPVGDPYPINRAGLPCNTPYIGFATPMTESTPDAARKFQSAMDVIGTGGSGSEKFFKTTLDALNSYPSFLRNDAQYAQIMLTDTDDQSLGTSGQMTALEFKDALNLKKPHNKTTIHYIGLGGDGYPEFAGTPCPSTDNLHGGAAWALAWPNTKMKAMIDLFNSKKYKICENFEDRLMEMAQNLVLISTKSEIALTQIPEPASIIVAYNGKLLTQGTDWAYDGASNSIKFLSLGFFTDSTKPIFIGYNRK